MDKVLYLVHRIPYPPNKGDKIRSFNILRALSKKYKVYLASFIDDSEDYQYQDTVKEYCEETYFERMSPKYSKVRSVLGLIRFTPLTLDYYRSRAMQKWVNDIHKKNHISRVLVFSSSMAQYVESESFKDTRRIIDFVDIDSDKWRQYAASKKWPISWVYDREARYLQHYEKKITQAFDYSLFVSEQEARHYKEIHDFSDDKVGFFNNGVDTDYFSNNVSVDSPYQRNEKVLVFAGAMDYWANIDAVCWFVKEVFPLLKNNHLDISFYIVGTNPSEKVKSLESIDGVYVTGRVEDIRAYVLNAFCSVAPLRIARGIQNKVLEAMSMAKYVIASAEAIEGIELCEGCECAVVNEVHDYVSAVEHLLDKHENVTAGNSRRCMIEHYGWDASLSKLLGVLN